MSFFTDEEMKNALNATPPDEQHVLRRLINAMNASYDAGASPQLIGAQLIGTGVALMLKVGVSKQQIRMTLDNIVEGLHAMHTKAHQA